MIGPQKIVFEESSSEDEEVEQKHFNQMQSEVPEDNGENNQDYEENENQLSFK